METVRTAISIDKPLIEQIDNLAHELNTSRSRIFALAAREFIQHHNNLKLFEAINAAYDDQPDGEEDHLSSMMHDLHLQMVKEQW